MTSSLSHENSLPSLGFAGASNIADDTTSPCGGYICGASLHGTPHRTRGLSSGFDPRQTQGRLRCKSQGRERIVAFSEPKNFTQKYELDNAVQNVSDGADRALAQTPADQLADYNFDANLERATHSGSCTCSNTRLSRTNKATERTTRHIDWTFLEASIVLHWADSSTFVDRHGADSDTCQPELTIRSDQRIL